MSIRSELEEPLAAFATANNIPVAWEGIPFVAPTTGPYLEPFLLASTTTNASVDGTRQRVRGTFQINAVVHDGLGSAAVEALASQVVALYPVIPKIGTVSIEQPPNTGAAILVVDKRYIPIKISYRQELAI